MAWLGQCQNTGACGNVDGPILFWDPWPLAEWYLWWPFPDECSPEVVHMESLVMLINWDFTLILREWLWLGQKQHIRQLLEVHIYHPEFCWAGRLPSLSVLSPHSAGDLAAEIISCYFSQTLWRILWGGVYKVFSVQHIMIGKLIPPCLDPHPLNWGSGSQYSDNTEAVKLLWGNSDMPRHTEEWDLWEGWVAHLLKAWIQLRTWGTWRRHPS